MLYRLGTVLLWPLLNVCLAVQVVTLWRVLVTHRDHYFGQESALEEFSQPPQDAPAFNLSLCGAGTHNMESGVKIQDVDLRRKYIKVNRRRYERMRPFATEPGHTASVLTITSWTAIQLNQMRWMKEGFKPFEDCANLEPWMKCYYSSNTAAMLNHSHAVLFHARHMQRTKGVPLYRPPGQKWIFYEGEPPTHTWNKVSPKWPFWHLFNVTATYTTDSDIPLLYNRPKCQDVHLPQEYESRDFSAGKDSKVLWIVDECYTASQREAYMAELGKHIQIETYGNCGQPLCQPGGTTDPEACLNAILNSTYKFILVFESAFCYEYVTDKLNKVMDMNIIPIVLGLSEYTSMLPKGSYINAGKFESPENLAHYLNYVDQSDELYNQYIRKKYSMTCQQSHRQHFPCHLCQYLHLNAKRETRYMDVSQFWSIRNRCHEPKRFYNGIADSIIPNLKTPDTFS